MPTYLVDDDGYSVQKICKKPYYKTYVCFVAPNIEDGCVAHTPTYWEKITNMIREQNTEFIGWAKDWDRLCSRGKKYK